MHVESDSRVACPATGHWRGDGKDTHH